MEHLKFSEKQPGLTSTGLKLLALWLMLLDHIREFFAFAGAPVWLHWLGRLSAPLFLFCTAEGFAHTHNRRLYIARIYFVSTGMALIAWGMADFGVLHRADGFCPENGIFQCFFWLCVQWQGIDWLQNGKRRQGSLLFLLPVLWTALAALLPLPGRARGLVTAILPTIDSMPEGGGFFLVEGLLLYILRKNRVQQVVCWVCAVALMQLGWYGAQGYSMRYLLLDYAQWMSVLAAPAMLRYNGQRGKEIKWLFYFFYPAHIYALYALSCIWMQSVQTE